MVDTQSSTESGPATAVKDEVATQGSQLKDAASEHAGQLAGEVRTQAGNVLNDARDELQHQLDAQGRRLGGAMQQASAQLRSMTDRGDPGLVTDVASQLADKLGSTADKVEQGGVQALADDVRAFARRQPGLFLVAAGAAGFALTRLLLAGGATAAVTNGANGRREPAGERPRTEPVMASATAAAERGRDGGQLP